MVSNYVEEFKTCLNLFLKETSQYRLYKGYMFQCFSYHVAVQSHIMIGSTPPTPCQGDTQIILGESLSLISLNISISASQSLTPAVCTMWLVVGGEFSTLMHIKFVFLILI